MTFHADKRNYYLHMQYCVVTSTQPYNCSKTQRRHIDMKILKQLNILFISHEVIR